MRSFDNTEFKMEMISMRSQALVVVMTLLINCALYAQEHRYPAEDFYHRNISVPVDHFDKNKDTFSLYYELSSNFKFDQPTIFWLSDQQQSYGYADGVDELAQWAQFDPTFNLVYIEIRGRKYSYIDANRPDGTIDWEKVYNLFSSRQMIEDIEWVRRDLFRDHPESRVFIFARSGGGYIAQEYLAKYGKYIQRAYLQCAPNPIIMKQLDYPESRSFNEALKAADPTLPDKLNELLNKQTVPPLNLLWMLYRIRFTVDKPDSIYLTIINELSNNDMSSYNVYLKQGLDYSIMKNSQSTIWKQMGLGIVMSPLQCDGFYLLGDPPEYIDPIYFCLRDLSEPVVQLVEQKKVQPLPPPALKQFRKIDTEVFYQAGRYDYMTPYQVGIELAIYFKNYELFIAEDDHMMMKYKDCYPRLRNAFFKYGAGSPELQAVRSSLDCREWKAQP